MLFINPLGSVASNPIFWNSSGDLFSEKSTSFCSLKNAFEHCMYSLIISSWFIAGFTTLMFEIRGFIRTSAETSFSFAYIDAIAVPIEWAIIIGFSIWFCLIIVFNIWIRSIVSSENLDKPWPGRSNDRTEWPFDLINFEMKFRDVWF